MPTPYKATFPIFREAMTMRALAVLKIDPVRAYIIMRLAAVDMPPVTAANIADEINHTADSVRFMLKNMKADETIDRLPDGSYVLLQPKGLAVYLALAHICTIPTNDAPQRVRRLAKQRFDWVSVRTLKQGRQKKTSLARRQMRDFIERCTPQEFADVLKLFGMKPLKDRPTALKPGHTNEKRWK